jgi:acetyltransferase
VALKAESPAILHKTDAGAVRLGVRGADDVRAAFTTIVDNVRRHDPAAPLDGVLVQAMVTGGTEMVVGLHHDPQFGPVVMVGLGGIFVEVLEDVAFGAVPLTRGDAEDMLASLRGARILDGVRGRPRADRGALVDVLLAVSRLGAEAGSAIAELDLNPVVVLPEGRGAVAVDALVVLSSGERNQ